MSVLLMPHKMLWLSRQLLKQQQKQYIEAMKKESTIQHEWIKIKINYQMAKKASKRNESLNSFSVWNSYWMKSDERRFSYFFFSFNLFVQQTIIMINQNFLCDVLYEQMLYYIVNYII